jgi:hypothetical protein
MKKQLNLKEAVIRDLDESILDRIIAGEVTPPAAIALPRDALCSRSRPDDSAGLSTHVSGTLFPGLTE